MRKPLAAALGTVALTAGTLTWYNCLLLRHPSSKTRSSEGCVIRTVCPLVILTM